LELISFLFSFLSILLSLIFSFLLILFFIWINWTSFKTSQRVINTFYLFFISNSFLFRHLIFLLNLLLLTKSSHPPTSLFQRFRHIRVIYKELNPIQLLRVTMFRVFLIVPNISHNSDNPIKSI
jgi:hypothetical protein